LRSTHSSRQTVETSDVNATEAELYTATIQESRRAFESENMMAQGQLDAAIQASLEQMEKEQLSEMNKAIAISMGYPAEAAIDPTDQEDKFSHGLLEKIEDTEIQQALLKSIEANTNANTNTNMTAMQVDTNNTSWPTAVKTVVEVGYTFEEAMEAYSIYEETCRELGSERLVHAMIEYLSEKRQQQQLGW